jgi:glycosyltransferase involved in cell wall biosynthesis
MQPKVSIGIPTYNRPDGVLRSIKQLTAQTYANLEIVVSNNASTHPVVAPMLDHCARLDPRIKIHHQPENLGIVRNFFFVLENTSADYFMWAADDDEWHPDFVKVCMENMLTHDVGTVMPGFYRHNRAVGVKGPANLPHMDGSNRFADAMAFFSAMPHSIFYGLHKRATILWFAREDLKDVDDEYLLLRQILFHGIKTVPEQMLYTAGIDDAKYKIKVPPEASDRYFYQCHRLLHFAALVLEAPGLDDIQRMQIFQRVVLNKLNFVLAFEKDMRDPAQYQLAMQIFTLLSLIDWRHLPYYSKAVQDINQALAARATPQS